MKANLKPFNLEAALKGEPVMMRNRAKAYVRHHETEINVDNSMRLIGFDAAAGCLLAWCENGSYSALSGTFYHDIIGMYPKTHSINGFEVPAPETDAPDVGSKYFVAHTLRYELHEDYGWSNYEYEKRWLGRGLVFLNKEDAIANTKAMLGIDPYIQSID